MNIIGVWNKEKIPGEHETSWPFGTLDLDISNNVTTIENESVKLVYEGTIFDRTPDELISSQTALDNAYGLYSYVKINKKEQEIIIGTDKLGFSPIYYSIQEGALIFSTSLTLAKYKIKNASPDYEAWDEILNIRDIIGEKTTIKEIKRLNAGTRIHIKNATILFNTFWSPEIPVQTERKKYAYINNELLAEALELTRDTPSKKIVLLSGGEDSRRIGVSAHAIKFPITFATQEGIHFGNFDEELIIAKMVSERLKIHLIKGSLPSSKYSYNNMLVRDYWLGFETIQHEWIIPLIKNLPKDSLIYDGIAGDVTINAGCLRLYSSWMDWYRDKDIDRIVEALCAGKNKFQDNMFQIDRTKLNSSLYDRVREELLSFPDCPQRLNYFVLMNHTRRNTALQAQIYNFQGYKTCCPFLYYPLFIQSLSIDPKYQLDMMGHQACMKILNPEIAKIPSTTRGNLNKKYHIDRSKEGKERELLLAKKVALRPEVKKIFPHLRTHFLAYDLASLFRITKITSRMNWRTIPLSRMSMFFDWLEDSNQPGFPVSAEEPSFLKERFIV